MKQNWTYKKLGEICEILNGFAFKSDEYEDNGIRVMRITNVQKGEIVDDDPKFFPLKRKDEITKYILREGDVLMSLTGNVGRVGIMEERFLPAALNQRVACLRLIDNEIDKRYLFHILNSDTFENDCVFNAAGIAQKNMSTRWLEQYKIPVPPIETQSRIVSELDLLQSIIDKQKAQLNELDNLAQAVFYDMFGDPVENDKGWEVKRLEDLCEVSSAKRVLVEDVVESGIPFLRGTELTALSKVVSSKDVKFTMFITPEHYERVKSITGVPKKGDILIPSINSEGITWVVDTDEPFYFKDGRVIWVHVNIDAFVSQYLSFVISKILKANYTVLTSGATFLELKLFIIRDLIVPIPPLSLQQSFASKIESIEKQKAAITQSIAEMQKLFDYTMDKYFG